MSLVQLIANKQITIEELERVPELIERARFVNEGLAACRKTLLFPLGVDTLQCYNYTDRVGEYESWGTVDNTGLFRVNTSWGGSHEVGFVNLNKPEDVFLSFENSDFAHDLQRFLEEQIEKAKRGDI